MTATCWTTRLMPMGLLLATLAWPRPAQAHLGPPFPIIVDQPIPGYIVNVLANPDTSQAVAYVVLERDRGPTAWPVKSVDVWDEPVDHHRPKKVFSASTQFARGSIRYFSEPEFDTIGPWKMGFDIRLADGTNHPFVADVTATPPGVGRWGLLLFSAPLILFGALFIAVVARRRRGASKKPVARRVAVVVARGEKGAGS